MDFCYFGSNNIPEERDNAKWWLDQLEKELIEEARNNGIKNTYKKWNKESGKVYNKWDDIYYKKLEEKEKNEIRSNKIKRILK